VLRKHVGGASKVDGPTGRLRDVLEQLAEKYPGLNEQVFSEAGQLHRFLNVYLNDEDVRFLEGLETKVEEGDVIAILPAVAGG
jgi:MoaD family protein